MINCNLIGRFNHFHFNFQIIPIPELINDPKFWNTNKQILVHIVDVFYNTDAYSILYLDAT